MLISLEAAAEGAAGLGEGGRGPKVEPGVLDPPGLYLCKDPFRSAALGCTSAVSLISQEI